MSSKYRKRIRLFVLMLFATGSPHIQIKVFEGTNLDFGMLDLFEYIVPGDHLVLRYYSEPALCKFHFLTTLFTFLIAQ
jgi:hypothetical protein